MYCLGLSGDHFAALYSFRQQNVYDFCSGKKQLKVTGLLKYIHADDAGDESASKSSRAKYSDVYKSKKSEFKLNGVKSALLLGFVPQKGSEDRDFLCELMEESGIDFQKWWWICDIKVIVSMTGLQSCSSKFPNPFCKFPKGGTDLKYELRKFEDIIEQSMAFHASGKYRRHLKDFESCEHHPIAGLPDEGYVCERFMAPVLHITLGVINKWCTNVENDFPTVSASLVFLYN